MENRLNYNPNGLVFNEHFDNFYHFLGFVEITVNAVKKTNELAMKQEICIEIEPP